MLKITKIFHVEMAHAIHGYSGACKNIHGHSYELHITVAGTKKEEDYIPDPGFLFNFKELKKIVSSTVIEAFDHKLILSVNFLKKSPATHSQENLVVWEHEPTAENLLIHIRNMLKENLPEGITLASLKLYETKDSYAEWVNGEI